MQTSEAFKVLAVIVVVLVGLPGGLIWLLERREAKFDDVRGFLECRVGGQMSFRYPAQGDLPSARWRVGSRTGTYELGAATYTPRGGELCTVFRTTAG